MFMKRLRRYLVAGPGLDPAGGNPFPARFAVNLMTARCASSQKYQPGILLQELFNTDAPVHIPGSAS